LQWQHAPQNGFGAGLAYVGHLNTENWRNSWDVDAVGSNNASWRAGVYAKFVHAGGKKIGIVFGTKDLKANLTNLPEHTVYSLYAQAISLNKLTYFGLGPPLRRQDGLSTACAKRFLAAMWLSHLRASEDFSLWRDERAVR